MRLFTYRLARQHQSVVDRVDLVMDEAARLIGRREPRGVGQVEITVTVTDGMPDLVCAAHEVLLNASDWESWASSTGDGLTTLNRTGSLVIVNAQLLRGRMAEVDKTVLHELTHAAQYNRPGAREAALKSLAYSYGIGWLTDAEIRAGHRRKIRDEREAEAAERLHRQLAKAVA